MACEKGKKESVKMTTAQNVVLYFHDLVYMLLAIMLVFLLVFRVIVVSGNSMYSTLWDGDFMLLLSNTFYSEPKQGDVVVISKRAYENGKPIVKRVIATEGQTVDIDFQEGVVYVDGQALEEDYIFCATHLAEGTQFPLVVEENHVFVMGDNRGVSKDSRDPEIGQIDTREILGKAIVLMIPGTHHGQLARDLNRVGIIR